MNMFPIVVLCGGKGTRVRDKYPMPKSLIEFQGRSFIDYQFEIFNKNNFSQVFLCLGEGGELIEKHTKKMLKKYFNIKSVVFEIEKRPLGTAGAIANILDKLPEKFFVTYGDSYVDMNYQGMQRRFEINKPFSTMAIYKNGNKFDKSNVKLKYDTYLEYSQNPTQEHDYIDAGVSIYNRSIFKYLGTGTKYSLKKVQQILSESYGFDNIQPYIIENRFYEIGSYQGIEDFRNYVNNKS